MFQMLLWHSVILYQCSITDVSYNTCIKLVVLNISTESDSPPDVTVETFSLSVTDKWELF